MTGSSLPQHKKHAQMQFFEWATVSSKGSSCSSSPRRRPPTKLALCTTCSQLRGRRAPSITNPSGANSTKTTTKTTVVGAAIFVAEDFKAEATEATKVGVVAHHSLLQKTNCGRSESLGGPHNFKQRNLSSSEQKQSITASEQRSHTERSTGNTAYIPNNSDNLDSYNSDEKNLFYKNDHEFNTIGQAGRKTGREWSRVAWSNLQEIFVDRKGNAIGDPNAPVQKDRRKEGTRMVRGEEGNVMDDPEGNATSDPSVQFEKNYKGNASGDPYATRTRRMGNAPGDPKEGNAFSDPKESDGVDNPFGDEGGNGKQGEHSTSRNEPVHFKETARAAEENVPMAFDFSTGDALQSVLTNGCRKEVAILDAGELLGHVARLPEIPRASARSSGPSNDEILRRERKPTVGCIAQIIPHCGSLEEFDNERHAGFRGKDSLDGLLDAGSTHVGFCQNSPTRCSGHFFRGTCIDHQEWQGHKGNWPFHSVPARSEFRCTEHLSNREVEPEHVPRSFQILNPTECSERASRHKYGNQEHSEGWTEGTCGGSRHTHSPSFQQAQERTDFESLSAGWSGSSAQCAHADANNEPERFSQHGGVLSAKHITSSVPLFSSRAKNEKASTLVLHLRTVARANIPVIISMMSEETRLIFEGNWSTLDIKSPLFSCQEDLTATDKCTLIQDDIDRLLFHNLIQEIAPHKVKGCISTFTVEETHKKRRRWITHPARQNDVMGVTHPCPLKWIGQVITESHSVCFAQCLDIVSCFYHFALPEEIRPYYCFSFNSKIFCLTTIPTGGRHSAAIAHCCISTLASFGAPPEVLIHTHIDNVRFSHHTRELVRIATANFIRNCTKANIQVHTETDVVHRYVFLGVEWLHLAGTTHVRVADKTIQKLVNLSPDNSLRDVTATFSRLMYCGAILDLSLAQFYWAFKFMRRRVGSSLDGEAKVWPSTLQTWDYWLAQTRCNKWRKVLPSTPPDVTLFSDASLSGWGAIRFANGQVGVAAGRWPPDHLALHINTLELCAAVNALTSLCSVNEHILLLIDNTTAIAGLNRGRSNNWHSNNCLQLLQRLGFRHHIHVEYVNTSRNLADAWSRIFTL